MSIIAAVGLFAFFSLLLVFCAIVGLMLWLIVRHVVSLRRELQERHAAIDAEADMSEEDNLEYDVKRETPNFLYVQSPVDGSRHFVYKGDQDSDDWRDDYYEPVDRFWVETGVWSQPYASPLED